MCQFLTSYDSQQHRLYCNNSRSRTTSNDTKPSAARKLCMALGLCTMHLKLHVPFSYPHYSGPVLHFCSILWMHSRSIHSPAMIVSNTGFKATAPHSRTSSSDPRPSAAKKLCMALELCTMPLQTASSTAKSYSVAASLPISFSFCSSRHRTVSPCMRSNFTVFSYVVLLALQRPVSHA